MGRTRGMLTMGAPLRIGGGGPVLKLTATTTAPAQTVTLQQITPTGGDCVVDWGDSATSTITDGNTSTTTHQYASAGTYEIAVSNAQIVTTLDLRDSKITINTANMRGLPREMDTLRLEGFGVGSVFNTADFAGITLSSALRLSLSQVGDYTIDTAHFAGSTLSSALWLSLSQVGDYTIDTAHFAGSTPSAYLRLSLSQVGDYTIDTAHFAGSTPSAYLRLDLPRVGDYTIDTAHFAGGTPSVYLWLSLPQVGDYTIDTAHFAGGTPSVYLYFNINSASLTATTSRADWSSGLIRKVASPRIKLGLSSTQVSDVLLGIHDDIANRTASGGTLDVAGNNAAPSGTLQAACPPTTGKEAAYELVNDSCGVTTHEYAAVTLTT